MRDQAGCGAVAGQVEAVNEALRNQAAGVESGEESGMIFGTPKRDEPVGLPSERPPFLRVQTPEEYARMMDYFEGCGDARRHEVITGERNRQGQIRKDDGI
jgi:hypothetical protein